MPGNKVSRKRADKEDNFAAAQQLVITCVMIILSVLRIYVMAEGHKIAVPGFL